MSMFAVVSFIEENDNVFVVPITWVETRGQSTVCAWPNTKITEQVERMAKSNLPANVVRKSRTYERAYEKMRRYQISSDAENISSTDAENMSQSQYLPLNDAAASNDVSLSSYLPTPPSHPCTSCIQTQEYTREILSVVHRLSSEVKELIAVTKSQINVHPEERIEIDFLPAKSLGDLSNLDSSLKEEKEFAKLVKYLALVGGKDEKEATRRVLAKLIAHTLALKLTWAGSDAKQAFCVYTNILQLVAVCVRKNYQSCTQASVEESVKRWLRNAVDREGGRMRRKQISSTAVTNTHMDE